VDSKIEVEEAEEEEEVSEAVVEVEAEVSGVANFKKNPLLLLWEKKEKWPLYQSS